MVGVHPWQVALFADEAQQAVWGEDTNTRLSSSYAPTGKATVTEGGYTLVGKWSFRSGCDHCTWVLLGGLVFNEDGNVVDFKTFMVPREDYTIVDVWHMVGLSGTGSNDIVVEDVFIPEAFTLGMGETGQCRGPGQEQNPSDLYKLPFHSIFTGTITTPIIGMAVGAYDEHVEMQQKRLPRRLPRREGLARPVRGGPDRARPRSEIDAAWALLVNNIREEQDHVAKGEQIPLKARLKVRRDQVLGTPARHRRDRLAVRGVRRPRADRGHLPAAGLARRPRRPGARGQRPRAGAADVRRPRVRPQDRPRDVLMAGPTTRSRSAAPPKAGDLTLNYYEAGSPTGVGGDLPLVMLHGGGPGASAWSNFGSALPRFASDFRTLLVDQPGFGGSDKPPVVGNYFRFSMGYVVALLDELGIERVHLLGNSLGGGTATRLAIEHPDRVGRLVLMGPGGLSLNLFHADPTEGVKRLTEFNLEPEPRGAPRVHLHDGRQPGAGHRRAGRGAVRRRDRARRARGDDLDGHVVLRTRTPPRTACSGATPTRSASTPCSTWGREDRVNPLDGALVALKAIPRAPLHVFPNCGHWAQIEAADEFAEVATAFLARHRERPRGER